MADTVVEFESEELPPSMTNTIANGLTIEGAALTTWWSRQGTRLQQNFMDQIRLSLENGESTQQAVSRVTGVMSTSRRAAEGIVRTAINEIVTQTRLNTFQDMNDVVKAIQQISTLDRRTSNICIAYSGLVWDVNTLEPLDHSLPFNGGPPRHFNCRSSLVPVLMSYEELGIDMVDVPLATRASMDGEVPGDITFDKWLRGKSKDFQNNILGPTRARLWRNGEITLTQLVDMKGNALTLDQLESVVGHSLN